MSDPERRSAPEEESDGGKPPRGVNLVLIYSLMLVAFLVAMGLAALIVLPFYRHR